MGDIGAMQTPEELRVDLENVRGICRTFIQQQFKLTGFDEVSNVVIGVKPFASGLDTLTDFD